MHQLIAQDGTSLTFDQIVTEDWTYDGSVTEHAVEGLVGVSDHIQVKALSLGLLARVTESPFESPTKSASDSDFVVDDVLYPIKEEGSARPWAALKFLRDTRQTPYTYISIRGQRLELMALQAINFTIRGQREILFDLRFKQIRTAQSERVTLPPERIKPKKAKPKVDKGKQFAKTVPFSGEFKSAAADGFDAFGVTL